MSVTLPPAYLPEIWERIVTLVDKDANAIDLSGLADLTDLAAIMTDVDALADVLGEAADVKVLGDLAGTVSAKLRGLNSNLATLITNLSGFSIGTSTDGSVVGDNTGTLHSKLRGVNTVLGTIVPAGGVSKVAQATLTRPANVTAYAAGDEMTDTGGAIREFTVGRVVGGTGLITGLTIANSANAATKATGELRLYSVTSTPATDNAAFDAADGVNDTLVIAIPFSVASEGLTGTGGNCCYDIGGLNRVFKCGASDTKLYGRVIMKSAYTSPVNSDTWLFSLGILQD